MYTGFRQQKQTLNSKLNNFIYFQVNVKEMNAHQLYTYQNLHSQELQHFTAVDEMLQYNVTSNTCAPLLQPLAYSNIIHSQCQRCATSRNRKHCCPVNAFFNYNKKKSISFFKTIITFGFKFISDPLLDWLTVINRIQWLGK